MTAITDTRTQDKVNLQATAIRFTLGIFLSALSGIMLLLAFPPYGYWWLAWFAFVPSIFSTYTLFPLKWSSLAPATMLLFWLGPFMARLFSTEYGPFFTYLGVLIAILTFFVQKERKFHELTGFRWFVLQGVFGWVGFEMVRATLIPLVATNAFIGYTQATQAWLIQPVSIFSVYGLNLVIMLVNYALAQGAIAWYKRKRGTVDEDHVDFRSTRNWLIGVGVTLIVWVGISLLILNGAPQAPATVRVAALQPGFDKPAFQDEELTSQKRFDAFVEWTRHAAQQGAQIVYTPEMAFNFDPQVEFTDEFRALAAETGAYIFIDYTYAYEDEPFRNESVLLSPSGEFSAVYAKNKVPPGEPISPTAGVYPVFDTPLGQLAAEICHDGNYTSVTRELAGNGAQLISAGLNEFGGFGEQYWTNITFRAIENRVGMVVTARETGSAIIDPYGRQVAVDITPGEQIVLLGDVSPGPSDAPYTALGDVLGWVALAGWVFFWVFQIRTERRAKMAIQS